MLRPLSGISTPKKSIFNIILGEDYSTGKYPVAPLLGSTELILDFNEKGTGDGRTVKDIFRGPFVQNVYFNTSVPPCTENALFYLPYTWISQSLVLSTLTKLRQELVNNMINLDKF